MWGLVFQEFANEFYRFSLKQCGSSNGIWGQSEYKNTILDHNYVIFLWKFNFFEMIQYHVNGKHEYSVVC